MTNLTPDEVKEIIWKSYIRGALAGMLVITVAYGLHSLVLSLY